MNADGIRVRKSRYRDQESLALEESARIDEANNLRTLVSIMVPLCQPVSGAMAE